MTNDVLIRGSEVTATPSALKLNEVAYSHLSDTLFIGAPGDTVIAIAGASLFAKLASPVFTGSPAAPTQVSGDNSTKLATTGFVKQLGYKTGNDTISFSGDISGSGETAIAVALAATGVAAGTYTKTTIDTKGRVTAGLLLSAADIPSLVASKISD
ncbi:MAG: hypothetical protein V7727_22030, partial [Sneathiella sp.]